MAAPTVCTTWEQFAALAAQSGKVPPEDLESESVYYEKYYKKYDILGRLLKEGDIVYYASGARDDSLSEGVVVPFSGPLQYSLPHVENGEYRYYSYASTTYRQLMIKMQKGRLKRIYKNCILSPLSPSPAT